LALVAGISAQGVSTIKYFQSEDDLLRGTAMNHQLLLMTLISKYCIIVMAR
jgi:hypothetical protein